MEAEVEKKLANCERLSALMVQLFSPDDMTNAVMQSLLYVLESGGVDRLTAMADIIREVEFLRNMNEIARTKVTAQTED